MTDFGQAEENFGLREWEVVSKWTGMCGADRGEEWSVTVMEGSVNCEGLRRHWMLFWRVGVRYPGNPVLARAKFEFAQQVYSGVE